MKKTRKLFMILGFSIFALALIVAGLYLHYAYAPAPKVPTLTSIARNNAIISGDKSRTYLSYHPKNVRSEPALLIVLHGTNIDGAKVREWTGYEFDQLADQYGFLVAYPDGYDKDWNDCRIGAFSKTKKENVDDVGFIKTLISHYQTTYHIDPTRVYLFGYSSGGNMSFRIGLQQPGLIAAMTTVSAALPSPETCKCAFDGKTPRIMLINGTADKICPYNGGELNLFGSKRGMAISTQATAENFVNRNGLTSAPEKSRLAHLSTGDLTTVDRQVWSANGESIVELFTVNGGGHVIPQQVARFPRIMGKITADLDAPRQAVAFFGLNRKL